MSEIRHREAIVFSRKELEGLFNFDCRVITAAYDHETETLRVVVDLGEAPHGCQSSNVWEAGQRVVGVDMPRPTNA